MNGDAPIKHSDSDPLGTDDFARRLVGGPENPAVLRIKRGARRVDTYETIAVRTVNGFLAEAESFAALVRGGTWNGISERESIDVAVMLDALRAVVHHTR